MLRDEDVVEVDVQLGALPPEAALPRHVVRDQEEATPPVRLRRLQHQRGLLDLTWEILSYRCLCMRLRAHYAALGIE